MERDVTGHTIPEAAAILGISTRTVRRWIHDGRLVAELRPCSHGEQYWIEPSSTEAARSERGTRERPSTWTSDLALVLEHYADLTRRLEEQQAGIQLLNQKIDELVNRYRDLVDRPANRRVLD